ncbi:DUF4433 domain-containing protein [Desulfovibrio sulfodismutans]|uniref:DUF4433 domain-containing protein n=1 Tax=Desulfolutivibrio sulfodismutans TaxID=63561 RepID=A0A7K3NHR4_9BACT|nr:DarT ssDNA thymidine ADP-ribosyltransferase family protein [Desulfolutivibrio sulfodismutans]NDY55736.1 DUF4433 domain-containing protein [Desulfolutivibrio sulfodismutans]QLA13755.1 DUF4433 domain-containing protein [Desulfolutivibrio sulfodismutans DSM 3696]
MFHKLSERNVFHVYHFTDKSNIDSIINLGGLYSLSTIKQNNICDVCFGGNQWSHDADTRIGLDTYVHLCFLKDHPMEFRARQEGRINTTCWLEISIDVLQLPGVMYTNDVSNKTGVLALTNVQAKEIIDLFGIYERLDFSIEENKIRKNQAKKSEILVPTHVPLQLIKNIHVFR